MYFIIKPLKVQIPSKMDHYRFLSFTNLVIFLIFVFMILKIWKKSKTPNSPPGPWKLPLIGNMHQLASSLPHHRLRDLANKYGPIMHLQLGEVSHIVISSAEGAEQVMKAHDINFAERPRLIAARQMSYNYTDIGFAPYGDYWRQLRKICTLELFIVKRVQSFKSIREEEVSNLLRNISSSAGTPINLSKMLVSLSNDITARAAIGGKCKEQELLILGIQKVLELAGGFSLFDVFPSISCLEILMWRSEIRRLSKEADRILEDIINEHRTCKAMGKSSENEAEDLVDVLLNLQEHGDLELPLTTNNIKAVIQDIFIAGSDTSAVVIEWAMSELLRHPRVMEKVQEEVRHIFDKKRKIDETDLHDLEYMKLVIKETLRLHPPTPLVPPRQCRKSCMIGGYEIHAGTRVVVNAWAIGRDPNCWTEAETFYPERFIGSSIDYKGTDFEYIPFGAGRRMCAGMHFGIANVELPLARLLYHFNWKLPNGMDNTDLDMIESFGAAVGRKNNLCLISTPYRHFDDE